MLGKDVAIDFHDSGWEGEIARIVDSLTPENFPGAIAILEKIVEPVVSDAARFSVTLSTIIIAFVSAIAFCPLKRTIG